MAHKRAISPKPRMPISSTSASVSSGEFKMVTGSPVSLLKLFSFADVRSPALNAARARSLVLVLPTDPVIPITCAVSRCRPHAARLSNAAAVSATTTAVPDPGSRCDRYAGAPLLDAEVMNSWPSRSATSATNSCPGVRLRLSNDTPSRDTSGPKSVPPVALATSLAMKRIFAP